MNYNSSVDASLAIHENIILKVTDVFNVDLVAFQLLDNSKANIFGNMVNEEYQSELTSN